MDCGGNVFGGPATTVSPGDRQVRCLPSAISYRILSAPRLVWRSGKVRGSGNCRAVSWSFGIGPVVRAPRAVTIWRCEADVRCSRSPASGRLNRAADWQFACAPPVWSGHRRLPNRLCGNGCQRHRRTPWRCKERSYRHSRRPRYGRGPRPCRSRDSRPQKRIGPWDRFRIPDCTAGETRRCNQSPVLSSSSNMRLGSYSRGYSTSPGSASWAGS